MQKSIRYSLFLFLAAALLITWAQPRQCHATEKVGVLFLHVGSDEDYKFDWFVQFFDNIWDWFMPGQLAGGPLEGGDCYSFIHYADEVESAICGVAPGTPIDIFCTPYADNATYPITSQAAFGDVYGTTCYPGVHPYYMLWGGHSTRHPVTGALIQGPVVNNPNAAGSGIADFLELSAIGDGQWIDRQYKLPNRKDVHRMQALKWWYGNDAPGYAPDAQEPANIKDRLQELMPGVEFAFRHGWEAYMENKDPYGNPKFIPDSTETAISQLINDEGVDRIIVLHTYPAFSNTSQYGHEWYDENGQGISAIPGKTFKQCVETTGDGVGPATQAAVNEFVANRPWDKHWKHPFPSIQHMVQEAAQGLPVTFAKPYGDFAPFAQATLDLLNYTVAKYAIPPTASLKVILGHHGSYGAWKDAQDCDSYFLKAGALYNRVSQKIVADFAWQGAFEIAEGAGEYAEKMAFISNVDDPSADKPFGNVMSIGEQIDMAINGTYINWQGLPVNNGNDKFDYIIVIPYFFETESADTIYGKRETLGSMNASGVRIETDADGTEWDAADLDAENYTVRAYNATGWPVIPKGGTTPVYRGSPIKPTTVILTGTFLSVGNGPARSSLTEAAAEAAVDAVSTPVNMPPVITGGPIRVSDNAPLSTDPASPTVVSGAGQSVAWAFDDDGMGCAGACTHVWQYRADAAQEWADAAAGTYLMWVWTENMGATAGTGMFQFRAVVTDCAGLSAHSEVYYITIDMPPVITAGPVRVRDSAPLSTNPAAPTAVAATGQSIVWTFNDDKTSCSGPNTHVWQYRADAAQEWNDVPAGTFLTWVWTESMGAVTGSGTFQFRVGVTDCAGLSTYSAVYYITMDRPPVITAGPARVSDNAPLSTNPAAPTVLPGQGQAAYWTFTDDQKSCGGCTHQWQYRANSSQGWASVTAGSYLIWVWTENMKAVTGSGAFDFRVVVTDCIGQRAESAVYKVLVQP